MGLKNGPFKDTSKGTSPNINTNFEIGKKSKIKTLILLRLCCGKHSNIQTSNRNKSE